MAERGPSQHPLEFEHAPNSKRPSLIESYCSACGVFIAASPNPRMLLLAELPHTCIEPLKFFQPRPRL